MIRIQSDELQQRIDILEADLEVRVQNSDAKVAELDARYWVLPAGEERTAIAKETAEILIEILELRQDISAMKAEVRRLREAERQGILSHFRFMPMLILLSLKLLSLFVITYSYIIYLSADAWNSSFIVVLLWPLLSLSKVPTELDGVTSPTTLTTASSSPPHRLSPSGQENTESAKESEPLLTVDEAQPLAECTGIRKRTAWSITH